MTSAGISAETQRQVALNRAWAEGVFAKPGAGCDLPFSFVYGGRPSAELLGEWSPTETPWTPADGAAVKTLTLTDPRTGLQLLAVCTVYTDTPGVDWVLHFTHTGTADTPMLEQVRALDTAVVAAPAEGVVLHRLNGSPCRADDWQPFDQPLGDGERVEMNATHGRSANVSPFFALDWGQGGAITAIGWSGQWTAAATRRDGALRTQVGMQELCLRLRPGESIRSPRLLHLQWSEIGYERACNLFRRTMLEHLVPRREGQPVLPPLAHLSTSFYELNRTTEAHVLSHLEAVEGLGFEVFWLDAYWTGPGGFPDSMGNYGLPLESVEPADRFPRGLAHIGAQVRRAGLEFLLWFEPERVAPGTRIATEHPEWVLSPQGDGSGLLNLGLPDARQAITAYLDAAIKQYQLRWLRIDYNIDPLVYWRHGDRQDPERIGLTEIRYVEGLYRMWDDLRAANPGLCIDNCASGGRRIDLETCARAVPLWRSDNTCDMVGDDPEVILAAAIKNQLMSAGLNRYLPYSTAGQMGASPYLFRSGFNGGIAFAQDVRPAAFPRDRLRQALAEARRLRPYWQGDFHLLSPATGDPAAWCAWQYHRPGHQDGIVLAFRRHRSPYTGYECHLRQLDPQARYQVTLYHSYEAEPALLLSGEELERLVLEIGDCPGSVLVEYRRTELSASPAHPRH